VKHVSVLLLALLLVACAAQPAAIAAVPSPISVTETEPTRTSVETPEPAIAPQISDYAIFSINVQDFSYPELSAAVLDRIIDLHETYQVPVDIYLTDTMAVIFAQQYPDLLERLRTSPVVAISYHYRAPRPYANSYDWLGLAAMSAEELSDTILRYETHAVDSATGQTTEQAGGYAYVAELIGYAPYAASSIADDAEIDTALMSTYAALGAQITVVHGRTVNLGDNKKGLWARPEHYDYMLFQHVGEDAQQALWAAVDAAHEAQGATAPYFVGIKMHDNDFFATRSAWLTVYVDGRRSPNWNTAVKADLLTTEEQAEMWSLYEETVIAVATNPDRIGAMNLPMILGQLN
jgi:hypothetical protein